MVCDSFPLTRESARQSVTVPSHLSSDTFTRLHHSRPDFSSKPHERLTHLLEPIFAQNSVAQHV